MIVFLATATPQGPLPLLGEGARLFGVELGHVSLSEVPRLAPGIVLIAHGDAGQPLRDLTDGCGTGLHLACIEVGLTQLIA